jgi:cyanophycinase-like exopeptidase
MSDAIDNAAFHVAEMESRLDAANDKLSAARAAAAEIDTRVAALETERTGIIATARSGDADAKLALRIGVLDADLGDLRKIAADGKAGLANAEAELGRAASALASAEQALALAKDEEIECQLVAHVDQLAQLLGAGIAELRAIWARKRARPTWSASTELVRELERLRFVAEGHLTPGQHRTTRRSAA